LDFIAKGVIYIMT